MSWLCPCCNEPIAKIAPTWCPNHELHLVGVEEE